MQSIRNCPRLALARTLPLPLLTARNHQSVSRLMSRSAVRTAVRTTRRAFATAPTAQQERQLRMLAAKRILAPHLFGISSDSQGLNVSLFNKLLLRWQRILGKVLPLGGASEGNKVTVMPDGDVAFRAMWEEIDKAQSRICLETFILTTDHVGKETIAKLEAAAKRGVHVTLLYDAMGSYRLNASWLLEDLKKLPNVEVLVFNPVFSFFRKPGHTLLLRTHRKILIVDDRVGFAGGMNIGKEYAGAVIGGHGDDPKLKSFRDTHLRMEGPCVQHLAQVFLDSVQEAILIDQAKPPRILVELKEVFERARQRTAETAKNEYNRLYATLFKDAESRGSAVNGVKEGVDSLHSSIGGFWRTQLARAKTAFRSRRGRFSSRLQESLTDNNSLVNRQLNKLDARSAETIERREVDYAEVAAIVQQNDDNNPQQAQLSTNQSTITAKSQQQQQQQAVAGPSSSSSSSSLATATAESHGVFVQVLPSNVVQNKIHIQEALVRTLDLCGQNVWITNHFLIPPKQIMEAILGAAKRGVDVRIITGGRSDPPFMRWAATHIYHKFLVYRNVHIYEYYGKVLHAKTATIDGLFSSVGSFNLDLLSALKLLEVNIAMVDRGTAKGLELQFERDLPACKEVTLSAVNQRSLLQRLLHWACYWLARLVLGYVAKRRA